MAHRVALAFESGGEAKSCADMLAALRAAGVRATIFLDGRWAEENPKLIQALATDGHELGNHAYSHPDLTMFPDEHIGEELERTEAIALRLTGHSTRPWFRPPYQRLDDRVRRVATLHGFRCLSRDALDGAHYLGPSTPKAILERSLLRGTDGAVLTYHLHNRSTLTALPEILTRLWVRGVTVSPVSELPSPPPERSPLHSDFAGLDVDSGYLRMYRPLEPPQMINLLDLGADALATTDQLQPVGSADKGQLTLLVFNGREPLQLSPTSGEGHIACLAGDAMLEVRDAEDALVCTVYSQAGDVVRLKDDWKVTVLPWLKRRRAIMLLFQ